MRQFLLLTAAVALLGASTAPAPAADDTRAIIDKAIKATGGAATIDKHKASKSKGKGTLSIMGTDVDFTSESTSQFPNKFKEQLNLEVMGQKIALTIVYNGEKGWVNTNGNTMELEDQMAKELKDAAHAQRVSRLTTLKDKMYKLAPLGEVKVNDKPAVGVKVSTEGQRDVSLYFYKDNGLLAKVERRVLDQQAGQEVTEERIMLEYQDVDGQKAAKKILVNRDGKKYLESEVEQVKYLDKLDDSEFAKP